MKVVGLYWVNVSESSGTGSPLLRRQSVVAGRQQFVWPMLRICTLAYSEAVRDCVNREDCGRKGVSLSLVWLL